MVANAPILHGMLSDEAIAALSSLEFRADAERSISFFSVVRWKDELPEGMIFGRLPREDRRQILRLLGMRVQIWRDEELSKEDRELWDATRAQLPNWPLWRRLIVEDDVLKLQDAAETEAAQMIATLCAGPDKVTLTKDGNITTFRVDFKPDEDKS